MFVMPIVKVSAPNAESRHDTTLAIAACAEVDGAGSLHCSCGDVRPQLGHYHPSEKGTELLLDCEGIGLRPA